MAINSLGENLALSGSTDVASTIAKDKSILGKDDFMKLLLVQLQNQDPTAPMDSEKILSQTSQLASLETSENTNNALKDLTASLGNSQQFATVSAIGKTADLGSNAVTFAEGSTTSFEVYFPEAINNGSIEVLDGNGNQVSTLAIEPNDAGVYQFDWDGTLSNGKQANDGIYYITASYVNPNGEARTTRMGAYPIESVRFQDGKSLLKVGSSYVALDQIQEIY